jgi:effector-binding domain-containing protein
MNPYWRYVGGFFAAIIVIGILLPSRVSVEREIVIDAYAASVFALINDFRQIDRWSGWMDDDPNARFDISGPPRGVGASRDWEGQIIGAGRQTEVVLNYERDFGLNVAGRYFGLLLDGIIGSDYEAELERLKIFAENLPKSDFSDLQVEQLVVDANDIAYRSTSSIPSAQAISEAMADAYFDVLSFIDQHDLDESGAPLSITRTFSGAELLFDAGIPVRGLRDDTPRDGRIVKIGKTYAGPVIRVRHTGPYRTLGQTHQMIAAWLAALGIERNGDAWEVYISDPTRTIESELLTYVYYPVRYDDAGS